MTANFQSIYANLTSNNLDAFCAELFQIKFLREAEARQLIELVYQIRDLRQYCMYILSLINEVPDPNQNKPVVEFVYRGCVQPPVEVATHGLLLGFRNNPTMSIVEHKKNTGSSVYVSCSKSLDIAAECAQSSKEKTNKSAYIYKVRALGGIDCKSWFAPVVEFHQGEEEVLFVHHIPAEAVVSFSELRAPSKFSLLTP